MTPAGRSSAWLLMALLAVGAAARVAVIFAFPSINHPDEVYQLFEQAHRIAFGYGVKTWEFDDGIRSMVPPYALAALFKVGAALFGGPEGYLRFTQIVLAAGSLVPVVFIYRMGERESRAHALIAGTVAATWFELVYFSFRPLTEALACDFVLVAMAIGSRPWAALTARQMVAIGFCLAMTVLLRLQLAPGAALLALWLGRTNIRRKWLPMIVGAAPALVLFGAADWATWGAPFVSYLRTVEVNLGAGKASVYGVESPFWYLVLLLAIWLPLALLAPVALIAWAMRWRRSALWVGFFLIELTIHSLIPHKEYRFVFPAFAAFTIAAAMGSADLLERLRPRLSAPAARAAPWVAAAAWVGVSLILGGSTSYLTLWRRSRAPIEASFWLSHRPDLCGVMVYDTLWVEFGGYAFLHRRVPLYMPVYHILHTRTGDLIMPPGDYRTPARAASGAYNYVVLNRASLPAFAPAYTLDACFGGKGNMCVAHRSGPCIPDPALQPITAQKRLGEPIPAGW